MFTVFVKINKIIGIELQIIDVGVFNSIILLIHIYYIGILDSKYYRKYDYHENSKYISGMDECVTTGYNFLIIYCKYNFQ